MCLLFVDLASGRIGARQQSRADQVERGTDQEIRRGFGREFADRCTSLGVGPLAMADGSTVTTHNNDCQECDIRITHVPARDWPSGSKRPIYGIRNAYPRYVESEGENIHGPDYLLENVDTSIYNWTLSKPIGYIDQVPHTFAYTLGAYAIQVRALCPLSTPPSSFHSSPQANTPTLYTLHTLPRSAEREAGVDGREHLQQQVRGRARLRRRPRQHAHGDAHRDRHGALRLGPLRHRHHGRARRGARLLRARVGRRGRLCAGRGGRGHDGQRPPRDVDVPRAARRHWRQRHLGGAARARRPHHGRGESVRHPGDGPGRRTQLHGLEQRGADRHQGARDALFRILSFPIHSTLSPLPLLTSHSKSPLHSTHIIHTHSHASHFQNKLWHPESDGPLNFARVFGNDRHASSFACTRRVWRVFTLAAPSLLPVLSGYTDGFATFGFGANLSAPYPFSVKVDSPLTVQDIMNINRDQYEGSAFDLTQGTDAGPFGDPMRYAPVGKTHDPVNGLSADQFNAGLGFQRPISLWRTAYSSITQSRAGLPDEIGAVTWVAQYAPHHASFLPVYASAATPSSLNTGTQYRLDKSSNYWIHCLTGNYLSRWYAHTIGEVQAFQRRQEAFVFAAQAQSEQLAARLLLHSRSAGVSALQGFAELMGATVRDAWWTFFFDMAGTFRDMYMVRLFVCVCVCASLCMYSYIPLSPAPLTPHHSSPPIKRWTCPTRRTSPCPSATSPCRAGGSSRSATGARPARPPQTTPCRAPSCPSTCPRRTPARTI